jgi:hypothetical protein
VPGAAAGAAPASQAQTAEPPQAAPEVVVGDESEAPESTVGDYADSDSSALSDFRGTLDPYGSWVEDPTYGTVWVPSQAAVGEDFVPYQTAGHWAYEDDYVWVSDYSWGWAPFHYGRWVYGGMGWGWIPGRRYAGAWVSWRYGWDDWAYVGWAPLAPTWCWHRGIAVGIGFVPVAPYAFVATGDLFAPHLATRVVVGERVGAIGAHTRPWVPASPAVAGHVIARPSVGGPPPSVMRIPPSAVVGTGSNQGVMQARAFARPNSAVTTGLARAGTTQVPSVASTPSMASSYGRYGGRYEGIPRSVAPAYGPPAPSHFGGRLGAGFSGSGVASAWGPTRAPSAPAVARSQGISSAPAAPGAHLAFASPQPRVAAPAYHASANVPSVQSTPSVHGFSGGASTGGFHGGGGYSGASHGSGFSGGGSHGGGGGSHGGGHR